MVPNAPGLPGCSSLFNLEVKELSTRLAWEGWTYPSYPPKWCFLHFQLLLLLSIPTVLPSVVPGNQRVNLYWMTRSATWFNKYLLYLLWSRHHAKVWGYKAIKNRVCKWVNILGTKAGKDGRRHETWKGEQKPDWGTSWKRGEIEWIPIGHIPQGSNAVKNIICFPTFPSPHSGSIRDHNMQTYSDALPSRSKSNFPHKPPLQGMDFTEYWWLCSFRSFLSLFLNFSFRAHDFYIKRVFF